MIAWEKSKEHFQFICSRPFLRSINGLDYWTAVEDDSVYVAFQQSQGANDWAANLNFFPENFDIYPGRKSKLIEVLPYSTWISASFS